MMSTQTQSAAPNDDEPTAVVADDKATVLAGLAWSDDAEDYDDALDEHRDRTTFWLRLFVATATAVVLVLGVMLWFVRSDHEHRAAPPVAAPAPTLPPAVTPAPTSRPSLEHNYDLKPAELFLWRLRHDHIPFASEAEAVSDGKGMCSYLESGHHKFSELMQFMAKLEPDLTPMQRAGFAGSANAFCPQFGYLGDDGNNDDHATS